MKEVPCRLCGSDTPLPDLSRMAMEEVGDTLDLPDDTREMMRSVSGADLEEIATRVVCMGCASIVAHMVVSDALAGGNSGSRTILAQFLELRGLEAAGAGSVGTARAPSWSVARET